MSRLNDFQTTVLVKNLLRTGKLRYYPASKEIENPVQMVAFFDSTYYLRFERYVSDIYVIVESKTTGGGGSGGGGIRITGSNDDEVVDYINECIDYDVPLRVKSWLEDH